MDEFLPRVLIVDDLFGRCLANGTNEDRDSLCASFMLRDVTDEAHGKRTASRQRIKTPIAEAVFIRGQLPVCAADGDVVSNDLEGTLQVVRDGWTNSASCNRWSLVMLDLCFYTGKVTGKLSSSVAGSSDSRAEPGMPEGSADDISPSQYFGLTLLRAIHAEFPDLPVIILSSQERGKVSQEFSAHGASAFLPRTSPDGEVLLRTYLDRHGLMPEPYGLIVGRSLPLLKALRAARRTAYNKNRENILIRGERGVGKEEFSKYIHRVHPSRACMELISVNSAVLTAGLFASELFGIEKRKATGVDKHEGAVARAHQGDLFFDEVKDMIPEAQAALLRFLEEGTFIPTGSDEQREVDVRVISATNADLDLYTATSRFREDLLDRLQQGGAIVLPPLRDRKDDIPLLAQAFVRSAESQKKGEAFHRVFTREALNDLAEDDWPGNVRVLRDVVQKVVWDNDVEYIYPGHIEKAKKALGLDRSAQRVVAAGDGISSRLEPPSQEAFGTPKFTQAGREQASSVAPVAIPKQPASLAELIHMMKDFAFDLSDPDALYNQLDALDEAAASLVIGYLLASLRINKDHISGEPEVTKAIQFATGKKDVKTSGAYDLIKRLMKRNAGVLEASLNEPLLSATFKQANATRPTNRTKKG